jgi:hypothetical protein
MDWEGFADGCICAGKVIVGIAGAAVVVIGSFSWITVPICLALWPGLVEVNTDPGMCIPWIGIFILHLGVWLLLAGIGIKQLPPIVEKWVKRIVDARIRED